MDMAETFAEYAERHGRPDGGYPVDDLDIEARALESLAPAPATLLAITAWQFGDGMIATLAPKGALHVDPSSGLADLIRHAVHAGIRPADVKRTFADAGSASPADVEPRA
jgi:hypothetical protein